MVRFLLSLSEPKDGNRVVQLAGSAVMSSAKTTHRHSIFDNLAEKYPELPESSPVQPARPRMPRLWIGLALVAFLGVGALGLYLEAGDPPSEPKAVRVVSPTAQPKPAEESAPAAVDVQLPALTVDRVAKPATSPDPPPATEAPPAGLKPRPMDSEPLLASLALSQPPKNSLPSLPKTAPPAPKEATTALCAAADLRDPVKLHWNAPEYPEAARQAFLEGTVIVEALVDETGAVLDVKTLRSVATELDQAALVAVATWSFEPATCAGQPIPGRYRTALNFDLTSPEQTEPTAAAPSDVDLEPPVRLFAPQPTYPPAEWVAAVEGDVSLRATVDESGLVVEVEVLQGVSPGLDAAAVQALKRWRFRPARRSGEPARFAQVLTFRFRR